MGLFKEVRIQHSGNGISPAVLQTVQKRGGEKGKLSCKYLYSSCALQGIGRIRFRGF